jgi:hypothetical protein
MRREAEGGRKKKAEATKSLQSKCLKTIKVWTSGPLHGYFEVRNSMFGFTRENLK